MKKILLINPPVYDFKLYDEWMNPQGLLYLSSLLKQSGFQVLFKDYLFSRQSQKKFGTGFFLREEAEKPEPILEVQKKYYRFGISQKQIYEEIKEINYDLAFVGSFLTYWYPGSFEIIKLLKEIHPQKPVWLGGIYAELCSDHALKSGADRVFSAQSPLNILEELSKETGLVLCSKKNDFYETIDIESVIEKPYFSMLLSLGCPYHCSYCASSVLQKQERVLRIPDMNSFKKGYEKGIRNVAFFDDALLYYFEEVKNWLLCLEKEGLFFNYHTPNGLHIGQINSQRAYFLKEHGFKTLRFGLESLDFETQQKSGFKATLKKIETGIIHLKKAGFKKKEVGFYILLSPFVTMENIEKTMECLKSLEVNLHLNLYSPIPGTRDFEALAQKLPEIRQEPLLHNDSVFLTKYQFFAEEWISRIKKEIQRHNSLE